MPSKRAHEPRGPDWPPEKTLRVLRQQFEALQGFKGKSRRDVEGAEDEWIQLTKNVMIHGFGEGSQNVSSFSMARHAGQHNIMGVSERQAQRNFELRLDAFHATLASSMKELELCLPEADLQAAYEVGEEFAFYIDLKGILAAARGDVFVVDNYLNSDFFELYVTPIPPGVWVRILTDEVRGNLEAVARKFAGRGHFELKSSADVHDRHVFVNGRGWMIGQSIKDAAKRKPTYMVEIGAAAVPGSLPARGHGR